MNKKMASNSTPSWRNLAAEACQHRDKTLTAVNVPLPDTSSKLPYNVIDIPRQLLNKAEVEITELSTTSLVAEIASGSLTSTAVVSAFLKRAVIAQKLTKCVYELLAKNALARAEELDEYFKSHKSTVGPLHGLPISVKAHVAIKGTAVSAGFVHGTRNIMDDNAVIVNILVKAGAILYVRTTEPQGLMALETISNITGRTSNPHNTTLTAGGSSGGEGALIALRGSSLGIGTDIGGSIRSPATNCGLYGFKPTTGRIPVQGMASYALGCEAILGALGPLSSTLEGIELFMKTVLDTEPWRQIPSLLQHPWRDEEVRFLKNGKLQLNIGVLWHDGIVQPSSAMTRALREVCSRLENVEGFSIRPWEPYKHDKAMQILEKLYAPDGGKAFLGEAEKSGEPIFPLLAYRLVNGPGVEDLSHQDYWDWIIAREVYRYEYLQEWNRKAPDVDVILCPAHHGPAQVHETTRYWGYLSVWNLLEYPAVVFPVTRVNPAVDKEPGDYTPLNDQDAWCQSYYSPEQQEHAPVGLQLVGKKLDDEGVIAALRIIKDTTGLPFVNCLAGETKEI